MRLCQTLALLVLVAAATAEPVSPRVVERYRQMLAENPVEGVALDRLWKIAVEAGKTDELIAGYLEAGTFAGEMIAGHLLRKAERPAEAETAYSRAAAVEPGNVSPLLALGRLAGERAEPRKAAEWLEKAVALLPRNDPRTADTLMQLGAAWSAAGDRVKAIDAWERMMQLAPADVELRGRLAASYAENNMPDDALRHFEFVAAHANPAVRAQALQQISRLHAAAGRREAAIDALERAVDFTAPGHWLRSELLGQIVRLAQRWHVEEELERKWLEQAARNPRDSGRQLRMVEFYERTGNPGQQRAWLEKILALMPGNGEYELRLARLLAVLDQIDDAAVHFDKALAAMPRNTDLIFERAVLDLRREDGAAARKRILAMMAARKGDETLREKALAFYLEHHLLDLAEVHLRADASAGSEGAAFALANFLFSQRRNDEARSVVRQPGKGPPQAARHLRAAQLLKAQGELSAAVAEAEAAVALEPGSRDASMLLGEIRVALLQYHEARIAFEAAYAKSRSDAERNQVDGKLFESLRASAPVPAEGLPAGSSAAALVEGHIRELMSLAIEEKTAAAWLRVARWKTWNGDKASAVTFATKAAEMEPQNPAPREFLAQHSQSNGDGAYAIGYLREAMSLNPDGRDRYLREIAQTELQFGNSAEALAIFEQLATGPRGSVDALAELASAQERTGKFQEAAATLRKAVALAPAPRKRELNALLLRVLDRLGLADEAADLLLRAVDGPQDERERLSRFDELLLFCQQHDRLPWLRSVCEERRKAQKDDYFPAVALGRVLKQMGEKEAAFELFSDAVFATPDQSLGLSELVREAEELGRLDAAVRLQEQITRIAPQDQTDGFLKLAALQQKTGDLEGTERTWDRAVAKFPRDAEVLRQAADFHHAWGDGGIAAKLLRKLIALEPANLRAAADLAELESGAGDLNAARAACEMVMQLTKPVGAMFFPSERGGGPWGDRSAIAELRSRPEWPGARLFVSAPTLKKAETAGRTDPEAGFRLGAVRILGEIARKEGGVALEKWLAAWRGIPANQPTEAMWALYFAGARETVLEAVEEMARKEPATVEFRQAFVWMALESGLHARLGAWLNAEERTAEDMELFSTAFSIVVKARPEMITPAMLKGLFPGNDSVRLWSSAVELSRAGRAAEAISLGRRVFDRPSSRRAAVGRELARWHLSLGQIEEARRVLTEACSGEGDSFESPVFSAMRDLYFVVPETERASLVERWLRGTDENSLHGQMTRVLLHGIEGREEPARSALDRVLERSPLGAPGQDESNSAIRKWNFVAGSAVQLLDWNLPRLALHAWDSTLVDDGLLASQGLQLIRGRAAGVPGADGAWSQRPAIEELLKRARAQRDALSYIMSGRIEREQFLNALAMRKDGAGMSRLGEAIEARHGAAAAVAVFLRCWERDPEEPAALRKLIESCRSADDVATAEAVRKRCLAERINPGNDTTPREFALELADLLEGRGAIEDAVAVIGRAVERNPGELRLLFRQAQLLERAGRPEQAETLWVRLARMDGGTAHARGAIAQMFEKQGRFREAIEVRVRGGASGDTQLPVLYYKDGRTDEALAAFEKLTGSASVYAAMTLAEAMGLRGEGRLARSVLVSAAAKASDAKGQMQVRSKLLTIPGLPPGPAFVARTQLRMREFAGRQPGLAGAYFEFFDRCSTRFGIEAGWEKEIATAWADGSGVSAAGLVLLGRQCAQGDVIAAKQTCERLLAAPDVSGAMLEKMDALLAQAHRPELRPMIAEAKARLSWPFARGTIEWVRLLDSQGLREEARTVLRRHEWLAGSSSGAEALGQTWLDLGDPAEARRFFVMAMKENALVPAPSVLAGMARVHLAGKNFTAARLLLRRAFTQPSCHELDALVEYLDVTGEIARWSEAVRDFDLSPSALHELKRAIFSHFEKRGEQREALALIAAEPALVSPAGAFSTGADSPEPVTCERVRSLARRSGHFDEAAAALEWLAGRKAPDAAAQLAALYADKAQSPGDTAAALPHLEQAAKLRPASWEFARRCADILLARNDAAGARAAIERFLAVSQVPAEREAAFERWERAHAEPVRR